MENHPLVLSTAVLWPKTDFLTRSMVSTAVGIFSGKISYSVELLIRDCCIVISGRFFCGINGTDP